MRSGRWRNKATASLRRPAAATGFARRPPATVEMAAGWRGGRGWCGNRITRRAGWNRWLGRRPLHQRRHAGRWGWRCRQRWRNRWYRHHRSGTVVLLLSPLVPATAGATAAAAAAATTAAAGGASAVSAMMATTTTTSSTVRVASHQGRRMMRCGHEGARG